MKEIRESVAPAADAAGSRSKQRKPRKARQQQRKRRDFLVGVGASAGGLEAITTLVSQLPGDLGIALVVVQHLSPTHRSMMVQLLARATRMQVIEAVRGDRPRPNCIHIAPANANLILVDGCFELVDPGERIQPTPSVNAFFKSLAETSGADAIGLVLSGTGTDGAEGIRAIYAAGGTTFAQDPNSAKYDGMPNAAIDTGCIHGVLTPEKIAEELIHVVGLQDTGFLHDVKSDTGSALKKIFTLIRKRSGVDFSGYKETTVYRRLERRMAACDTPTIAAYVAWLEQQPQEIDRLYQDILISVTAFFRDVSAFKSLQEEVRQCVARAKAGDQLRIWVPGCATGEEAYSISMLFAAELGNRLGEVRVQIYATDIDMMAMAVARKAQYPSHAVAGVDPLFLERYFASTEEHWQIIKPIREMVVFARHDLSKDPPFLRVNIISCRNVLIYFNASLQERVLQMFHYALVRDGALFLGKSESIHYQESLFTPVDKNSKLYRPNVSAKVRPAALPLAATAGVRAQAAETSEVDYVRHASLHYLPAGVLLNGGLKVLTVHGEVGRFLSVPAGKFDTGITHLIHRRYRADLMALLHRAKSSREAIHSRQYGLKTADGASETLRITVRAVNNDDVQLYLVAFETTPGSVKAAVGSDAEIDTCRYKELEQELNLTREHLQTVVEELETSNEELQSLNEELQATNEELQTANEELQTSNEELQSTNEELVTVNDELQFKSAELLEANLDLENIQHSVGFVLVTFNTKLRVVRANQPAQRLFELSMEAHIDLNDIALNTDGDSLAETLLEVIKSGKPKHDYAHKDGREFLLRIGPWRNNSKQVVGAVMSLVDRTELAQAERDVRESQQRLLAVMNNSSAMISVKDLAGRYEYVNPAFLRTLQRERDEVMGKDDTQLFDAATRAEIKNKDLLILRGEEKYSSEDRLRLADGDHVFLSIRFPVHASDGSVRGICTKSLDITERKQMEQRFQAQTELMAAVLDSLNASIAVLDRNGTIIAVNKAWRNFAERYQGGAESSNLGTGANYLTVVERAAQDLPATLAIRAALGRVLRGEQPTATLSYECPSGERPHWFHMTVTPLGTAPGGAVIAHSDITEQREAEAHLRLVATVFERSSEGIVVLDARGHIQKVNAACCQMIGKKSSEILERHWRDLNIAPLSWPVIREIVTAIRSTGTWQGELALLRDKSVQLPVWVNFNTVRNGDGISHYIALFADISRLKAAENSLYELAYHDPLTGLPNRTLFLERTIQSLSSAERRQRSLALMFLDLDRFKIINDSLGHMVGDELLRAAASRIQESVRKSDVVARVGGDEFVVMLEDLRHAEDAAISARKIIAALGHPFEIKGHEVVVQTSIGITLFPEDGRSVEELLKNADASMYTAKEKGGNRYQFFTSQMHQNSQRRLWLESQLRQALHRGELSVHYQPQIELGTNQWRGLEALLRWTHSEQGVVSPTEFIPVAEETRLIEEIGAWVLETSCDAFKRLRRFVPTLQVISVNVSAHQLRETEFVDLVEQTLQKTGLPAGCLEIEITESVLVDHAETAVEVIQSLRSRGVRFSLDDFGTGYSSLSYLRRFPINAVKIDESFIRDILVDANDVAIVQAILALANVMGLEVIAEGVENDAQYRLLQEWDCRYCQGFYTGRPVAEDVVVNSSVS